MQFSGMIGINYRVFFIESLKVIGYAFLSDECTKAAEAPSLICRKSAKKLFFGNI